MAWSQNGRKYTLSNKTSNLSGYSNKQKAHLYLEYNAPPPIKNKNKKN